ncbi:MAG: XisI protein [Bacteroidota bacterium]
MDKIKHYEAIIIQLLEEIGKYYKGTTNPLNLQVIVDEKNRHYQLLMQGWDENGYTFQCLCHLDIIDGKVWIQWNDTEEPLEVELMKMGVPASDIVLGLKRPEYRQYTDFALG